MRSRVPKSGSTLACGRMCAHVGVCMRACVRVHHARACVRVRVGAFIRDNSNYPK